jgi:hypothetical protein
MQNIIYILLIIFFTSCTKKIEQSKPSTILIKSEKFKFYDTGFINKNNHFIEIKLFSTAKSLFDLKIENDICINLNCYKKDSFNRQFLSDEYEDDFLEKIFRKQKLNNSSYTKTNNGFIQESKNINLDFIYKVENNNIYFKDFKNKILIKIKELK